MKQIKDYLHLYLGCEIIGTYRDASGSKGYLTGITNGGCDCEIQFILEDGFNVEEEPAYNDIKEIKPILRPLSDMTEMELGECVKLHFGIENEDILEAFKTKVIKRNEVKSILRYGTSIPYTMLKENGEHYLSGTLSFSALSPEQILYLLSKQFDLFDLIESGLAIDSTTLKPAKP